MKLKKMVIVANTKDLLGRNNKKQKVIKYVGTILEDVIM